ncbi:MAG: Energy-coupling factor transporter transmembrane protein EcfT [Pelotomaculum sp. PtaB.Bin104]|nr:MAG: Energy-coupling factor transporter transmembrane protein EcfT [Pelotomaculum sp. PtaB.Bin104]
MRRKMRKNQDQGLKMGQFVLGNSIIHRLDPRTKIIGCLLIIFSVLINFQWYVICLNVTILSAAFYFSGVKAAKILRGLRKLRYILLLSFIFQATLTTGELLFQLGVFKITREGVNLGLSTVFRLMILYMSSILLTTTTSPLRLASGIESLLSPLRYARIPVHQLSMLISTSLRFIPTIIEEAETLTRAQRSRGAQFNSPKVITRLRSFTAVLIPLLAASLQRANDLAIAMESRCYTGGMNRTRLSRLQYRLADRLSIAFILSAFTLSFILI